MKIYPKENYVVIQPQEEKKKGSIEIPAPYRKKTKFGEVVGVHPSETCVTVGDTVQYKKRPMAPVDDSSERIVVPVEHLEMKIYE